MDRWTWSLLTASQPVEWRFCFGGVPGTVPTGLVGHTSGLASDIPLPKTSKAAKCKFILGRGHLTRCFVTRNGVYRTGPVSDGFSLYSPRPSACLNREVMRASSSWPRTGPSIWMKPCTGVSPRSSPSAPWVGSQTGDGGHAKDPWRECGEVHSEPV